jgi:hypothetical protein
MFNVASLVVFVPSGKITIGLEESISEIRVEVIFLLLLLEYVGILTPIPY